MSARRHTDIGQDHFKQSTTRLYFLADRMVQIPVESLAPGCRKPCTTNPSYSQTSGAPSELLLVASIGKILWRALGLYRTLPSEILLDFP